MCIRMKLASRRDSRPDEAFDSIVRMLCTATEAAVKQQDIVVQQLSQHGSSPASTPASTPISVPSTSPRGRHSARDKATDHFGSGGDGMENFDAEYYRRSHAENVAKFKQKQV
jgi:hypothetical protein